MIKFSLCMKIVFTYSANVVFTRDFFRLGFVFFLPYLTKNVMAWEQQFGTCLDVFSLWLFVNSVFIIMLNYCW